MSSERSIDGQAAQARFDEAVTAHQQGNLDAAERGYRDALAADPGHAAASNNLGLCLAMSGRLDEAVPCFRRALDADPDSVDAAVNLAQALEQAGQDTDALDAWHRAAAIEPGHMEPLLAGGLLAARTGELELATQMLSDAAGAIPRHETTPEALLEHAPEVAAHCLDAGRPALTHRLASALAPLDPGPRSVLLLEACLRQARVEAFDATLHEDLLCYFRSDAVDHRELSRVASELVVAGEPALAAAPEPDLEAWMARGGHRDELLLRLLTRGLVATPVLEKAMTALRRRLAQQVHAGTPPEGDARECLMALAVQCFVNEYVFAVDAAEADLLVSLEQRLRENPRESELFALLACYRAPDPLQDAPVADAGLLALLLRRCVHEPREEHRLRAALAGAEVSDAVSRAVREQYETSPYPRWENIGHQQPITVAQALSQSLHGVTLPAALDGPVSILIAGCGTGAHALRVAMRHPDSRITAIDLSTASLAFASRKATQLGIDNAHFAHRDLLELGPGDGPFHLIESSGVLHHLRDPAAGLAALVRVLAADGVIKLALYSRRARASVNEARRRIAELGLDTTPEDMRALRQRILDGREPALAPLLGSLDFYAMSPVRDLLFHVQEHQFDPAGLAALLEVAGLRCLGFQVSPTTRRRYLERFPEDNALASFENWQRFEPEFPNTFDGMYQFWCTHAET